MKPASPYLTAKEACEYLRIPTMNAFYSYRYKVRLKAFRRGGKLLFKQSDLDASLEEERPARGRPRTT
jgi:hypothetical protein